MLRVTLIVLSTCLLTAVLASTPKERLLRDLLDDYNSNVDPGNITLKVAINLICASWDPTTRIVTNDVWEKHSWKDERLKWCPAEHAGIHTLKIPAGIIWTPDTVQYTSLSAKGDRDDNCNVVLTSDGTVMWIPRATYRVPCTGDEEINCTWRFGSWAYDGFNLALEAESEDPLGVSHYSASCPLQVTSHEARIVTHTYECCPKPYPSLDATIVFRQSTPAQHCTGGN